jgi:hypothetical protein
MEDANVDVSIGIDPGKNGFITAIIGKEFIFAPIPLIGKFLDIHELNRILGEFKTLGNVHCVFEDVHARYGSSAKATFSFGFVCGATEACIIASGIPFTKVQPKEWQKIMWQGIPIQKKASSTGKTMVNDTKLMSLMACKRLFPDVDLRANNRCKIPHDGKVDSILLAEYGRRKIK